MTNEQIASKIEKDFNIKVLRIEPATVDGKAIVAVTVMSGGGGGDWNQDDAPTVRPARPRYRIDDLVAAIAPDNRPEPIEFPPAGEEKL